VSARMTKPWLEAAPVEVAWIPAVTGVYEIRDANETVLDIGYAGAREPFGLRSAIRAVLESVLEEEGREGLQFRYESHVQYMTRYIELVLAHRALHGGEEPARVARRPIPVTGRLSLAEG
jgi:hypothetical protein